MGNEDRWVPGASCPPTKPPWQRYSQWQMLSRAKVRRCQSKDTGSCPLTSTWMCTQHACMNHLPTHAHSAWSDIPVEWFCQLSYDLLTFSSDSTGALVNAPLFVVLCWWTARQTCRGAAVVEEGQGCRCSRPEVVAPSLTVSLPRQFCSRGGERTNEETALQIPFTRAF